MDTPDTPEPPTPDTPENLPPEATGGKGTTGRREARDVAAAALAAGLTAKDAAAKAGLGERTVRRWLAKVPGFKDRVREIRAAVLGAALGRLTDGMTGAADALNALVGSDDEDVRFRAAKAVVELALRVRDAADLEERLAAVERQLREGGGDGGHAGEVGPDRAAGAGPAEPRA